MAHHSLLGGFVVPLRSPEHVPSRSGASCGAGKPALPRPQHGGSMLFSTTSQSNTGTSRSTTALSFHLGGATAAVCGTLCSRRARGRDRRKPFHFSLATGQFDQAS